MIEPIEVTIAVAVFVAVVVAAAAIVVVVVVVALLDEVLKALKILVCTFNKITKVLA